MTFRLYIRHLTLEIRHLPSTTYFLSMCGICGIIPSSKEAIKRMNTSMAHRGPDGAGYYEDDNISLGHSRLAIIDLETGDQPIFNENRDICIVFNGEIYNYKELRRELKSRHRFYTDSDTEVIVHLYEELGSKCLNRLNGMFAFAIWDKSERKLLLARDRMGIKPLYYTDDGAFVFASELKALIPQLNRKEIDPFAFSSYLTLGYVISPHAILKGVKRLPQGHFAIWKDGKLRIEKYWSLDKREERNNKENQDISDVAENIRTLIDNSVKVRLQADVPLGVLLSGGLDSAIITAVASKYKSRLKTFTVGFKSKEYDERGYAKIVSERFNTEHRDIQIDSGIEEHLYKVMEFVDEPIADEALITTYLISKLASEEVKVVLTGEGGDENFAGYPRYLLAILSEKFGDKGFFKITSKVILPFLGKRQRIYLEKLFMQERDILKKNISWLSIFSEEEKKRLYNENLTELEISGKGIESLFRFDLERWLPDDVLQKLDRMTMANSIEGRVPLLDHKLVSYCRGINKNLKIKRFNTKYILNFAYKDILPGEILRRRKHGFLSPFEEWFDESFLSVCRSILGKSMFNYKFVEEIIKRAGMDRGYARKLWTLIVFELWRKKYGVGF